MSGEFSILGFIEHLAVMQAELVVEEDRALRKAAEIVEKAAKDSIGEYQPQSGPFAAWDPLAQSTQDDRERRGYPADEPELRTGDLRDSIETAIVARAREAEIGSDSDVMVWQELGTAKMPPRSILGGAAARSEPEVIREIGDTAVAALLPRGISPVKIR